MMFKLMSKMMKPFIGVLFLALMLLGIQAMTDLALPDYLSEIVNVGLQQGGIESSLPEVVDAQLMEKRLEILSQEERENILGFYERVEREDSRYQEIKKDFTLLSSDAIYILGDIAEEDMAIWGPVMTKAILQQTMMEHPEMVAKVQGNLDDSMMEAGAMQIIKNDYEVLGLDVTQLQQRFILKTGLIMVIITLIGAVAAISVGLIASRVSAGVGRNLRGAVFEKVSGFSNSEFDTFSTASLITRTTNDVSKIQQLVFMSIRMALYAPIIGVGGVFKAVEKSSSMSWIIALAIIIMGGVIMLGFTFALPRFKAIQSMVDGINRLLREHLSGLLVIRAFNNERFHEERFDEANKDLTRKSLLINCVMTAIMPFMNFMMNGIMVVIVWVGAHEISSSAMQVGDMMAFMQYAMQIIMAFLMLSMMFIMIPRAAVSANRINEVLAMEPSIVDPENPKSMVGSEKEKQIGTIEFDQVSFKYPGAQEDMLKDISFTAQPGEVTAIIGSTGSGKTTLLNLIPRFYDITSGVLRINGEDVRDVKQSDLREAIAYVPQKSSLFRGTIASNLKYGKRDATMEELTKAAETAQALPFINEKAEGFMEPIATGGSNVSGGQRQRLSIARAIAKKAPIYLFDDSFSALDFATDAKLRQALNKEMSHATLLVVAQRVSTIKNAQQIIVLDDGKIVGKGTHAELLKSCNVYREIALSQLSEEELS